MTGRDASDGDMPVFSWSTRGGIPPLGDPALDALLTGNVLPEDAPEELRPVAEALIALNAAPHSSELAAEARARAMFRTAAAQPAEPVHSHRRKRRPLPSLRSVRLAVAVAAGAVLLGGAALGAYAGVLPIHIQSSAHDTSGAPPAQHTAPPTTAIPQATGTAHLPKPKAAPKKVKGARGLCNAYAHQKAHGKQNSAVFRKLAAAAGGAANVPAYCASLSQPGPSAQPSPLPTQPAPSTGAPNTPPGQSGNHPTGKPSSHPTGQPSHPSGQPTSILA